MTGGVEEMAATRELEAMLAELPEGAGSLYGGICSASHVGGMPDLWVPCVGTVIEGEKRPALAFALGPGKPGYLRDVDASAVAERILLAAIRRSPRLVPGTPRRFTNPITGEPIPDPDAPVD